MLTFFIPTSSTMYLSPGVLLFFRRRISVVGNAHRRNVFSPRLLTDL